MSFEIIYLFISYFIILFSIVGYGFLFKPIFFGDSNIDLGYYGLVGIFFLIIYSYISHFFFAHNIIHNSILVCFGNLIFLYKIKNFIEKKMINLFFLNFFILFIALIIFKTHDDFPYYHFPYSYYLTQEPMLIGIGQFNHGFRTPSSLFYLNSLFYLPIIKYYTFYIPTLLIMGFVNLILLKNILKFKDDKKKDYIYFYSLFFFIFVNIFFYRIQEHGTDRSAQILIIILLLQLFTFIKFEQNYKFLINYILLTLGIIISLKAFYFLYLILILPLLIILYLEKKLDFIIHVLKQKNFYIFLLLLFLVLSVYFFNTGCFVYPVPFTCIDGLNWSIGADETAKLKEHYNLWSKAGKTPNFEIDTPEMYLKNFNWVPNWMNMYFFNKISDFLFGIFVLILIVFGFFYKKGNKKKLIFNKEFKYLSIFYFFLILMLFEWFLNHPSLRYGGYVLIASLLLIPFSIFIQRFNISETGIKKKIYTIICITLLVFVIRNSVRINDEITQYTYKPLSNPYYLINENHFRVQKKFDDLISNYNKCIFKKDFCDKEKFKKLKKFANNRFIFIGN